MFVVIGVSQAMTFAMSNMLLLSLSPKEMHGRVMSIYMLDWAIIPLGAAIAGFVADVVGIRIAIVGVALLGLLAVSLVAFFSPRIRSL
jgi:predicted MFS family arabinose efflux permease